jgi:glycosyltransferase involved in cell wall biosynthesis
MLELAYSPPLVARLGDRARRYAEGLTWGRTAQETEDHLKAIIAGSAGG